MTGFVLPPRRAPLPPMSARPAVSPAAAVVVIHEVFGVNADMRQSCDELAAQGHLAICPDLFWRVAPGLELADQTEAELAKAAELYRTFDLDSGVRDIVATIAAARRMTGPGCKVGVVGYCLGGLLSLLVSARSDPDAAVAYYPGNAENHLEEATEIRGPLLVHLGEKDEYIGKDAQRRIVAALEAQPGATVFSYPGCHHAFARHRGSAYDAAAARLANGRSSDFLALHLKAVSS